MSAESEPPDSDARPAKRFFVSIGVQNAGATFAALPGVPDDIERMRALFVDVLGYQGIPVALDPTAEDLREAVTAWQEPHDLADTDTVVVYYTGHAVRDGDTLFLITRGTLQMELGQALKAADLCDLFILHGRRPAKMWVILDCCSAAAVLSEAPFKRAAAKGISMFALAASGTDSEAVDRLFSTAFDQVARSGQHAAGFDGFCAAVRGHLATRTNSRYEVPFGTRATEAFDLLAPLGSPQLQAAPLGPMPQARARPRRVSRRGLAIATCLAALAAAGLWRLRRTAPPPPADMTMIAGATMMLGTDLAQAQAMFSACGRTEPEKVCGLHFPDSPFARQVNANHTPTTIPAFWLDTLEVTNRQFAAWLSARGRARELQARPWRFPGTLVADMQMHPLVAVSADDAAGGDDTLYPIRCTSAWSCRPGSAEADRPATHVAWFAADGYCRAQGKRLPTQAEWELAARGPEHRAFPWGDASPIHCGDVAFDADLPGCTPRTAPAAVGTSSLDQTPVRVRDLGGNVTEWTSDLFAPVSPDDHDFCRYSPCRITRGGSYREKALWLLPVIRGRFTEESVFALVGFRCAKSDGQ